MANRFVDSNLFKDEWFCSLSPNAKVFWLYYITNCDHAGLLKINSRLIEFECGASAESLIKDLGNRLVRVKQDLLWMPKFFKFQYPTWPEKKWKAAESAIEKLQIVFPEFKTYLSLSKDLPKTYGNGIGNGNGILKESEPIISTHTLKPENFETEWQKAKNDIRWKENFCMAQKMTMAVMDDWLTKFHDYLVSADYSGPASDIKKYFANWLKSETQKNQAHGANRNTVAKTGKLGTSEARMAKAATWSAFGFSEGD